MSPFTMALHLVFTHRIRFQQPMRNHDSDIALFPQVTKMEKSFCGPLDNATNDELILGNCPT